MSSRHDNQPITPDWGRSLALAVAVLFFISLAFPVTAAVAQDTAAFPPWWGVMDVALAFALALLALVLIALTQGKVSKQADDISYRVYRILLHTILALLVVFFVFGDRITWINGLPGIAWRAWYFLYCLPAWITLYNSAEKQGSV